jgi:hypothetical protein
VQDLVPGCPVEASEAEDSSRTFSAGRHSPGWLPRPQLGGDLSEGDISDGGQGLDLVALQTGRTAGSANASMPSAMPPLAVVWAKQCAPQGNT